MRVLALAALAACYTSSSPPPAPTTAATPVSPVRTQVASAAPLAFPPAADDLGVLYPARAAIDTDHRRVFVHRNHGIDVFELSSGKPAGRIDLGWDGDLWPALTRLVMFHMPAPHQIEAALVDHAKASRIATCTRTVTAPSGSLISRVDAFSYRGTSYLKWETSPPPEMHGGARMTDEQISASMSRFRAAYACGLLAIHVTGTSCSLDEVSYKAADLESCETRNLPPLRVPASTIIGDVQYAIEESSGPGAGTHVETSTLVVHDRTTGAERWRTVVDQREIIPPPP